VTDDGTELDVEALMRSRGAYVQWHARRLMKNHADAEEVAQNVWLRIHRRAETFHGGSTLHSWVYRITVNCAMDFWRRSVRPKRDARRTVGLEHALNVEDASSDPDLALLRAEQAALLDTGLRALRPALSDAVTAIYIDGLTYREAAMLLDVPMGTVKTRVHRGLRALRRVVNPPVPYVRNEPRA
jgi:RNA polymerase sigma-70 factor (ECF subfamily)